MIEVEKCDCGRYACTEDVQQSDVSTRLICSACSVFCPNCGRLISEDEVLYTNKCYMCDEDY